MIRTDFRQILRILLAHNVDFILVGALSAVLQGAPVMTIDVDIVHGRSKANIEGLSKVLAELDAYFRGHPGKKILPTHQHLATTGHQLLATIYGPLDLLGAIEHGLTYEQLLEDSIEMTFDEQSIQVLSLAKYVELKEESPQPKDLARLPVLRETLALQEHKAASEKSNNNS